MIFIEHQVAEMKVITDIRRGNCLWNVLKPSLSSCLDQVGHILFPNIFFKTTRESSDQRKTFISEVETLLGRRPLNLFTAN